MTDTAQPLGQMLDALGVTHTPDDGELVTDAVVIMKVVDASGKVSLRSAWSDGMSWIERLGMLRVAERVELPPDGDGWHD